MIIKPDPPILSFYGGDFVHSPLPYHFEGNTYSKRLPYGWISFSSQAFVPYGLYGRLGLTGITNLAHKAEDSMIVSITLYELLKSLRSSHPTGSQLEKMTKQIEAWCTTLMTISYNSETRNSYNNLLLVDAYEIQLQKNLGKDQRAYFRFTDQGKRFLRETSIPIPHEAVRSIKRAFDFDCLAWLITSNFRLAVNDKAEQFVTWEQLADQFGVNKYNLAHFRKSFCEALYSTQQAFYPQARATRFQTGIMLHRSPLLVKNKKDILLPSF